MVFLVGVFLLSTVAFAEEGTPKMKKKLSFGFGQGYYYGGLGVNLEYPMLNNYVGLFAGIGRARVKGGSYFIDKDDSRKGLKSPLGYAVGANFYPLQKKNVFRPRAGVYYGYNGIYYYSGVGIPKRSLNITTGIGVSAGADIKITDIISVDFDVIFPITKKGEEFIKVGSKVYNLNQEDDSLFFHLCFGIRIYLQKLIGKSFFH
jgi:hypothetical protein